MYQAHSPSQFASYSNNDVERALSKKVLEIEDFAALISPVADSFLERIASKSRQLTRKRFGNTIDMFAPLYVSNECQNICTYCGFSFNNTIERTTLTSEQIVEEAKAIKALGFNHVLIVSGEANKKVSVDYFENTIELLKPYFSLISLEVQPLKTQEYKRLISKGLHSVFVYQETYNREVYKKVHPKGKKSNFDFRLQTPERLGASGVHKIGLGVLLGLFDWRLDALSLAHHLAYLRKKYWQIKFSISFPRLRPASGVTHDELCISEQELAKLIFAFRLFDENVDLSLSTRETPFFRDNIAPLGITSMSAGSKTDPGGYAVNKKALKQFETSDERSPDLVAAALEKQGLEAVWKNWDRALVG